MNGTKLVLSIIGLCAIIVPAILLVVLTGKGNEGPDVSSEIRQLDVKTLEDAASRVPLPSPLIPTPSPQPSAQLPTPSPSSPEAVPSPLP